jgi:hypothetical protein
MLMNKSNKMKHIILGLLTLATIYSCKQNTIVIIDKVALDQIAEKYVRLGLEIGAYDPNFVDAYYGPDSLKPTTQPLDSFPKHEFLSKVEALQQSLDAIAKKTLNDTVKNRAIWIGKQLTAFSRRIKIFGGERASFDDECKELFDAVPPVYDELHFQQMLVQLDSILPGKGDIQTRFQKLATKFVIPKEKLDTVFRTTIAEARKRTLSHYSLPETESFSLQYVKDKPWSGYNWYKGNFASLIQINATREILIDRAIDLACHEGYPGHHVYNMLLEKNLYKVNGWLEISLYPLFSPQSLIAEGSANYGIDLAFPDNERAEFCRTVLLPLAGVDTTGIEAYFKALDIKEALNYARNEAARGILNGTMTREEAMGWLEKYCLMDTKGAEQSINFIKTYGSYVINYNYGLTLIKNYISDKVGAQPSADARWEVFGYLLSNEVTPSQLLEK